MTIQEIKDLLVSVDPNVQRYDHDSRGRDAYTVWHEIRPLGLYGDGQEEGTIHFQVDRFTLEEDEEMAAALLEALESRDDIAVDYQVDYEKEDTGAERGWIHHIYDCEGF